MEHTVHVIFALILGITVATLASPISEDHDDNPELSPKAKELEALMQSGPDSENFHERELVQTRTDLKPRDQEDQQTKRSSKVNKIPVDELTTGRLNSILNSISGSNRKIAIGVKNEMGDRWGLINDYFYRGVKKGILPRYVYSGEALLFDAQGSEVSGVLTYCIPSIDETLAVMFSVGSSRNLWKVKLYSGLQRASSQMYRQMYNDQPVQGDDQWHLKYLWPRLAARGYMSSSREATLQIQILLQAPRRGPWVKG